MRNVAGWMAMTAMAAPLFAAPAVQQKVTGPIANYWMSAGTASGSGFGALGMQQGGAKPSMGDIFKAMRGGTQTNHVLELRLGTQRPSAPGPNANHMPPVQPILPLNTPKPATTVPTTEESTEDQPSMPQRPRGRILLYWGCGDHAGPNQPVVIDFSKILDGQPLPKLPFVSIRHQNPPAYGRYPGFGEWPWGRNLTPPATLVGAHAVKGSYTPDINFSLPAERDYMPPLLLDANQKAPAGGTILSWGALPTATGYFAMLFGAQVSEGARGEGDPTLIMWSSSAVSTFAGGGLLEYLPPAEARRLVTQKVVMSPQTTRCIVPAEVTKAVPIGLLSMIAYGDEVNLVDPPRPADPKMPWNINWQVKVRYKSTTGLMLGMPGMGGGMGAGEEPSSAPQGAAPPPVKKKRGGLLGTLRDAAEGAIAH